MEVLFSPIAKDNTRHENNPVLELIAFLKNKNAIQISCVSDRTFYPSNSTNVIDASNTDKVLYSSLILSLADNENESIGRFLLRQLFPIYNSDDRKYGEVLSYLITKSVRSSSLFEGLIRLLVKRAYFKGLTHLFHLLPQHEAQEYQAVYHKLNIYTEMHVMHSKLSILLVYIKPINEINIYDTITYEFTKDSRLLNQYYELRERCYRERLGVKYFSGKEEEYDQIGHVLIAHQDGIVIGGARLVISLPNQRIKLPLEEANFRLATLFPQFDLDQMGYCEITRMAVMDTYRKGKINHQLTCLLICRAIEDGCLYHFSVAPLAQARNSRKIFHNMGGLHEIQDHIKVPSRDTYEHYNVCLSVTYLSTFTYSKLLSSLEVSPSKEPS